MYKTIPKLANVKIIIAIISGFLRPFESEIGPANKLPNAKPIINIDNVNCALDVVV